MSDSKKVLVLHKITVCRIRIPKNAELNREEESVVYSVSEPHTQPQRGTVYINKKCVYCIFYSAMCIPATSISQVIDVAVEINTNQQRVESKYALINR